MCSAINNNNVFVPIDDLCFVIKAESRKKSERGQNWKTVFFKAFNSASTDAQQLSTVLGIPANDRAIKLALKTGGHSGLRPDQQRRFIGRQL